MRGDMDKLIQSHAALAKEQSSWVGSAELVLEKKLESVTINLNRLFDRLKPEYPLAKELNGKVILFWPDHVETVSRVKPKSPKKRRK